MAAARWSRRCWPRSARIEGLRAGRAGRVHPPRLREWPHRPRRGRGPGRSARGRDRSRSAAPRWRWPAARSAARSRRGRRGCSRWPPQVEAALDFSDEDDVAPLARGFRARGSARCATSCAAWLARPPAERLKDGVRVVIAGPPNAGKSSLLNALAGRDAAITSAIPGTTRDLIEAPVAIGGVPVPADRHGRPARLGRRGRGDRRRPRPRLASTAADIVLWLGDRGRGARRARSCVHAKADLGPVASAGRPFRLRNDRRRAWMR